jgi:hypothetical protein
MLIYVNDMTGTLPGSNHGEPTMKRNLVNRITTCYWRLNSTRMTSEQTPQTSPGERGS